MLHVRLSVSPVFWTVLLTSAASALHGQNFCIIPPPGGGPFDAESHLQQLVRQVPSTYPLPLSKRSQSAAALPTDWRALVILIDFPDYPWNTTDDANFPNEDTLYNPAHFDAMLFSVQTYRHPFSARQYTGSLRDFYRENSYGDFDIDGIVTRWYTASQPLDYYANGCAGKCAYPNSTQGLVEEAILLADPDVDYGLFDNDGNGVVDALFVVHAGPGAEEIYTLNFQDHQKYLWSHKGFLPQARQLDGINVSAYTVEPENGAIGVFCHEFGHALGLPDLYDVDGSSEGIGEWGLMGSGSWCHQAGDRIGSSPAHFSAWSKAKLGWLTPVGIDDNVTNLVIQPVEEQPVAYRLWRNGEPGPEYFLLENRQNIGFDIGLTRRQKDFGLPDASGLLIWHIDERGRQNNDGRRLVDLEEASAVDTGFETVIQQLDLFRDLTNYRSLLFGNRGDNGDPYPGYSGLNEDSTDYLGTRDRDFFDDSSVPNAHDNDGLSTSVAVRNITISGQEIIADVSITAVTSVRHALTEANSFILSQNYPNPFNPSTTIRFTIPGPGETSMPLRLAVYDVSGRLLKVLAHGHYPPGSHKVEWDGTDSAGTPAGSGFYFYRLRVGTATTARKMVLIR